MKKIRLVLTVFVMLVCAQIVCADDPLLVQVSCQGCSGDRVGIPNGYQFRADVGKEITLTASSTGGVGNKRYEWIKEERIIHKGNSFELTVAEDVVEYNLIVTDDGGRVSKAAWIVPISSQVSTCLPDFRSDIILRDEVRGRTEYAAGDVFTLEVKLDRQSCSDCPNYEFRWETDNQDVILVSSNLMKTEVKIKQGAGRSDAVVRAVITNGVVVRDCEIDIEIVRNTPPQFEIEHDEIIYSCEWFEVWPSNFKPGERGESGDFLYSCSAVLKNEKGAVVSSASPKTVRRNGRIPHFRLKTDGFKGIYHIEMTGKDSHLASTIANKTIGNILRGGRDRNAPVVYAPNVVNCIVGEICVIDASETMDKDRYVSNFGFYNVATKERLANSRGNYCSGPTCKHIFSYAGTYEIEIIANYFDNDDRRESEVGSKTVTVIVSSGNVPVTLTLTPTPTVTPTFVAPIPSPTAYIKTSAAEEVEIKRGTIEKFFSGIIDLINRIKNALNL